MEARNPASRKRRPSVVVESDDERHNTWTNRADTALRADRDRHHTTLPNGYSGGRGARGISPKRNKLAQLETKVLPRSLWLQAQPSMLSRWLQAKRRTSDTNGISPVSASAARLPLFGRTPPRSPKLSRARSRAWTTRQLVLAAVGVAVLVLVLVRARLGSLITYIRDPIASLNLSPTLTRRVWAYEIAAGHFPSHRMPLELGLSSDDLGELGNPGLPPAEAALHSLYLIPRTGARRRYLEIPSLRGPVLAFPPRPLPRTAIDLDVIMEFCDFSANRYVRDCLEILSAAATLDKRQSVRTLRPPSWRHLYLEDAAWPGRISAPPPALSGDEDVLQKLGYYGPGDERIEGPVGEPPRMRDLHFGADPACDPERPRIFHLLWAGDFTDKPYAAALSFLYSQNLGLHLPLAGQTDAHGVRAAFLKHTCRPQLWIHINPGPAASVQTPEMRDRLMDDLRLNPWSAPLLHDRFSEVIQFRFYNVSDHLDAIPELRHHWRHMPLFKSGQVTFGQKPYEAQEQQIVLHNEAKLAKARQEEEAELRRQREEGASVSAAVPGSGQRRRVGEHEEQYLEGQPPAEAVDNALTTDQAVEAEAEGERGTHDLVELDQRRAPAPPSARGRSDTSMFERVGSTSYGEYDRLTTTLSDMARFVLCHRYGGVYIDADTLLLRDWEELWNWRGAFAYRWSRLPEYNTAILRMHRYSALGSFIFKIALANGLDFHPMSVWQYLSRAKLHGLLLRLPDALFDPAWLNTEYYQRERPPFPFFTRFEGELCGLDFFQPSNETAAAPNIVGLDTFFRGAFASHWHNQWWVPFDPTRDYPDLGPRFAATSDRARFKFESRLAGTAPSIAIADPPIPEGDLSWATVIKRTYEAFLRGERPNMYGERLAWEDGSLGEAEVQGGS